jgi:hypothetical protein
MRRVILTAGLLASLPLSGAHAYQSPARFIDPAAEGGGGGRFFTGSPTDSLTCDVCHGAESPAPLAILGLPSDGYLPGQTYPVIVDWDDALESVALNLEVTDSHGHSFGTLTAPPPEQLTAADLCASSGRPDLVVGASERQLALVSECGGHQASLLWQAPAGPAPDGSVEAWWNGSLVASDGDGTVNGDRVTNIQHVLGRVRQSAPLASELRAGCSVYARGGRSSMVGAWILATVALLLRLRRNRAQ